MVSLRATIPKMTASVPSGSHVGIVTVRYWAAARAAAGVEVDRVQVADHATLADVLTEVRRLHQARPRLAEILAVCSVLVGDQPVGTADPRSVLVRSGDSIEVLPPFAGG